MPWVRIGRLDRIPRRGARVVETALGPVAIFRTADDQLFALDDRCPHQGGPLSQGLVHGYQVTCPLHDVEVCLASGRALECKGAARCHAVRVERDQIYLAIANVLPAEGQQMRSSWLVSSTGRRSKEPRCS